MGTMHRNMPSCASRPRVIRVVLPVRRPLPVHNDEPTFSVSVGMSQRGPESRVRETYDETKRPTLRPTRRINSRMAQTGVVGYAVRPQPYILNSIRQYAPLKAAIAR